MPEQNIYNLIKIDEESVTPKYLQITNSILHAIELGKIEKDFLLPSINELSFELDISRDTAEKAYKNLKRLGIIGSVPGKGYFIQATDFGQPIRVCLLFNKLSAHKKIIYDAFAEALGEHAAIDFYIYNNDFSLFKKILSGKKDDYTHYVIIPHFLEGGENARTIIGQIPRNKLVLMDKLLPELEGAYAAVYENFEEDIYSALEDAKEHLSKYRTIRVLFPEYSYYPLEIIKGVERFCQDFAFSFDVVHNVEKEKIRKGEIFINVMEDDLVRLIEKILCTNLRVGKDVGVISYNETAMKKIILDGITTVSTDFQMMGAKAAELILQKSIKQIAIPFHLTLRKSL